MIRAVFISLVVVHGLIHFFGFAKAFGLAALPQLVLPISRPVGIAWLVAGVLSLSTAVALLLTPRWWWVFASLALLTSQAVILSSWSDARFGTIANVILLLGALYGFLSRGPLSLPAEYERDQALAGPAHEAEVLTEADLKPLPEPVQNYVRRAGVVGQPRVQNFRAQWVGRIRASPTDPWMSFTAQQLNTLDTPRRFFLMDATMKGLPVDVFHAFDEHGATMRVRLLSAKTMVDAKGEVLTRSETVTLFNDLCLFAPSELVRPSVRWEAIDSRSARAHFTLGANTISATLFFDAAGELVDFRSDDRAATPEGKADVMPWTTPVHDFATVGPARVPTRAETRWHPDAGVWTYGEFELKRLAYNVGP